MGSKEQIADVRIYSWLSGSVFLDRAAMMELGELFVLTLAESITTT
jgi:hypothetical protein